MRSSSSLDDARPMTGTSCPTCTPSTQYFHLLLWSTHPAFFWCPEDARRSCITPT